MFSRGLILPAIVILLPDYLITQYFTLTMSSVAMIILINWQRPFKRKLRNTAETAHEVVIIFLMYHAMCFSDFVPDARTRHQIGYSMIGLTLLHLFIFYIFSAYYFVKKYRKLGRVKYALYKARK